MDLYAPQRFTFRAAICRVVRVAADRPAAFLAMVIADLLVLAAILFCFGEDFAVGFRLIGSEPLFRDAFEAQQRAKESLPALVITLAIWRLFSQIAWLRLLLGLRGWFAPPYRVWKDEARLLLSYILLSGLAAIAFAVFAVAALIIWPFFVTGVLGLISIGGVSAPDGMSDLFAVLRLGLLGTICIGLIRLSPGAAVMTLQQKFEPLSGWRATSGASVKVVAAYGVVFCLVVAGLTASLLIIPYEVMARSTDHPGAAIQVMTVIALVAAGFVAFAGLIVLRGVNAEVALVYRFRQAERTG